MTTARHPDAIQDAVARLTVGFIGLGDQGPPMATAERGFDLHVWARRPASLTPSARPPHAAHCSPPSPTPADPRQALAEH